MGSGRLKYNPDAKTRKTLEYLYKIERRFPYEIVKLTGISSGNIRSFCKHEMGHKLNSKPWHKIDKFKLEKLLKEFPTDSIAQLANRMPNKHRDSTIWAVITKMGYKRSGPKRPWVKEPIVN